MARTLKNRIVYFFRDGYRAGRVIREYRSRRGLSAVTVTLAGWGNGRLNWRGRRIKVSRSQIDPRGIHPCGVLWRGKIVPLQDFDAAA